jgi:hypothetical protein
LGELGAKRKCRFRFAECRAEEERMFARVSVAFSELEERSSPELEVEVGGPLDGDIVFLSH